jgi:acyl-CoA dehydrogenase
MPPGAPQFTRLFAALRTLRAMIANSMRVYERLMNDPKALEALEFQSMITLTKVEASEQAVGIVLAALRVCGLSGYRTDGDFSIERSLRDVLSSPIMINNERILANLASSSLLTQVPQSVRD